MFLTEMRLIMLGFLKGVERTRQLNKYFTSSIGYVSGGIMDGYTPFYQFGQI